MRNKPIYYLLFFAFIAVCLYTDRYVYKLDANIWYNWVQVSFVLITLLLTLIAKGWLKVLAFSAMALCFVELGQQLLHGNTEIDMSDNVSLAIVVLCTVGFIFMRRWKRKL